jgi:hypothetical protein
MSDIKFACPHCEQHIACDSLYCGEKIACPGCKGTLYVPPLAAAIPLHPGGMSLAIPVASKEKLHPSTVRTDAWTKQAWEQHASKLDAPLETSLLALLVLPFFVALILMSFKVTSSWIVFCFILLALAAGFYMAKRQAAWTVATVSKVILYTFVLGAAYAVLGVGILFVGCLACH